MPIRQDRDAVIEFLNGLVEVDRSAVGRLLGHHVPCTPALASHPTVQVGPGSAPQTYTVGILGVLNGYLGVFDDGPLANYGGIVALYDDGMLTGFGRTEDHVTPRPPPVEQF